jgi:hypothetical protein
MLKSVRAELSGDLGGEGPGVTLMSPRRVLWYGVGVLLTIASLGSAPATPSYIGVDQAMKSLRANLEARPQANGPGWVAFADSVEADLKAYSGAESDDDRLKALGKLYGYWNGLAKVSWKPAATLRYELQGWLRPRIALAWASRRLIEGVRGLPAATAGSAQANREGWVSFVGTRLGSALHEYESAESATARVEGLKKLQESLEELKSSNRTHPWKYSQALQRALDDVYDLPNLDARIDVRTMNALVGRDVIQAGPVWWQGQTTFVTPGRRTGFGLMNSDTGIVFYNSQYARSITPIAGFNEQLAADPQGRQATQLYKFSATSRDDSHVTVTAIISPNGLNLIPSATHSVDATVHSEPVRGNNLVRMLAGVVGMSQDRINAQVRDGALTRLRQQVPQNADELARIKAGQAQFEQNTRLKGFLPGDGTVRMGPLQMVEASFRSRPDQAMVGGTIGYQGSTRFRGADMRKPTPFERPDQGVTVDVHLASVLSNAVWGYLLSPEGREVHNVMIQGRKAVTDAQAGPQITRNSEYTDFYKAVEAARAGNDPDAVPIRVQKPKTPPEFTADAEGHLVAIVRDFDVEVGVPRQRGIGALLGGANAPHVYRFQAPTAELTISFEVLPPSGDQPLRLSAKIESIELALPNTVESVGEQEDSAEAVRTLNRAGAIAVLTGRVAGRTVAVPLTAVQVPQGFAVKSVSPMDPTGWIRLVLTRVPNTTTRLSSREAKLD